MTTDNPRAPDTNALNYNSHAVVSPPEGRTATAVAADADSDSASAFDSPTRLTTADTGRGLGSAFPRGADPADGPAPATAPPGPASRAAAAATAPVEVWGSMRSGGPRPRPASTAADGMS